MAIDGPYDKKVYYLNSDKDISFSYHAHDPMYVSVRDDDAGEAHFYVSSLDEVIETLTHIRDELPNI